MLYREYGKTGVTVSALGFGGMRFRDQKNVDACAALVKACHDKGITYFDTAIGYGDSEDVMGVALERMQKNRAAKPFYVSTKTMAEDADSVRRECERSLKRLRLPYIDFYHYWCILSLEEHKARRHVLREFEKLRNEGLIKHIVLSTHVNGADMEIIMNDHCTRRFFYVTPEHPHRRRAEAI